MFFLKQKILPTKKQIVSLDSWPMLPVKLTEMSVDYSSCFYFVLYLYGSAIQAKKSRRLPGRTTEINEVGEGLQRCPRKRKLVQKLRKKSAPCRNRPAAGHRKRVEKWHHRQRQHQRKQGIHRNLPAIHRNQSAV